MNLTQTPRLSITKLTPDMQTGQRSRCIQVRMERLKPDSGATAIANAFVFYMNTRAYELRPHTQSVK